LRLEVPATARAFGAALSDENQNPMITRASELFARIASTR